MRYCLLQHLLRVELQRFYPFYIFSKRDIIMWKLTTSVVPLLLNIFINFCMNSLQVCIDIYRGNSTNEL
ncbi:hypothetical protein SAMN02910322_00155 [Bacteroides thetaiotaomicron]|uniref:Uncharacterized protein n=1 Tax=Parabacteroides goldsteinii CL02T12C30 TaxID=999418 RepID=K5Z8D6_9BACT|nr:hypothetical protein HMPREF1076_03566 [Parabacteroides goldsteinii CL02T12C30]SEK27062.1 hypothetical protein SAMN02910322_00155 [Bacteroides thetaiotaomicron]